MTLWPKADRTECTRPCVGMGDVCMREGNFVTVARWCVLERAKPERIKDRAPQAPVIRSLNVEFYLMLLPVFEV